MMKRISVEAFEDRSRPQGGHAVILLHGVSALSDRPRFRIRPVEAKVATDGTTGGEHTALAARTTAQGTELVIGPDLVENPGYLPGTITMIEIPEAYVRGEFVWPSVKPLPRPRRRHLTVVRPVAEAEVPLVAVETEPDRSSAPQAEVLSGESIVAAAAMPIPSPVLADAMAIEIAAREPEIVVGGIAASPAHPALQDIVDRQAAGVSSPPAAPPPMPVSARPLHDVERTPLRPPPRRPSRWQIFAVGAVVLALGYGLAWRGSNASREVPKSAAVASRQAATATPKSAADPVRPQIHDLFRALSVGLVSPQGVHAGDKDAAKVIEQAEQSLKPGAAPLDEAEAAFWLKRYLAGAIGDEHTIWALTQLGTLLAQPSVGQPDYASARALWEIASAYGDPVAMCFVATLHELGLGMPADKRTALGWYQRAKQSGGCPTANDAIDRLSR